jgi:hypothetical protein
VTGIPGSIRLSMQRSTRVFSCAYDSLRRLSETIWKHHTT